MTSRMIYRAAFALLVVGAAVLFPVAGLNQSKPPDSPSQPQDDVLRVTTELVQTDVTVVDKKGRFVDNLSADQFELIIDDKSQPVSFFDRVPSPPRRGAAPDSATSSAGTSSSTTAA